MKLKEAIKKQKEKAQRKLEIRKKKGRDYAQEDILSNFKVMAAMECVMRSYGYGIPIHTPQGVAMWHLLHKLVRILNLWNKEIEPVNESLDDSHMDLENYSELGDECYIDYMKNPEDWKKLLEVAKQLMPDVEETE